MLRLAGVLTVKTARPFLSVTADPEPSFWITSDGGVPCVDWALRLSFSFGSALPHWKARNSKVTLSPATARAVNGEMLTNLPLWCSARMVVQVPPDVRL